jgi:nucleotide-binding universal stress UspA family protein
MYRKILVPLDRSREAEGVLRFVPELLAPEGEVILLHVINPLRATDKVKEYLQGIAKSMGDLSPRCHSQIATSDSVPEAICTVAKQEKADLIVMYTHDRKGLAKMLKGSVTEKVQHKLPIEVRVIKPRELVPA